MITRRLPRYYGEDSELQRTSSSSSPSGVDSFGTEFPDDTRSVTHSPETGGNLFARDESGYHDSRGLAYALPINAILSSYGRILVTSRLFPPLDPGKFSWVMTDVVRLSSPDNGASASW